MSAASPWSRCVELQSLNTLAVPSVADYFAVVERAEVVPSLLAAWRDDPSTRPLPVRVLGGGSNVLLAPQLPGLTLQVRILGRQCLSEDAERVTLRVGAGENWHQLVQWCLQQGYRGLENLALIPGTVGAAPVQNIGAYGVEIAAFVESVEALDLGSGEPLLLDREACELAYRDSVFKHRLRDRVMITAVVLRLSKRSQPVLHYPALAQALAEVAEPSPQQVFDAVCRIRREKLPDPAETPNCGSFFKNPLVDAQTFARLAVLYPQMPWFPVGDADSPQRKLAAAWLIDQLGWKGREVAGAQVHSRQALVLTNPRRGTVTQVLALAQQIQREVLTHFGVALELEPQLMGFTEHPF